MSHGEMLTIKLANGDEFPFFLQPITYGSFTNIRITVFTIMGKQTAEVRADEVERILEKIKEVLERGKSSR